MVVRVAPVLLVVVRVVPMLLVVVRVVPVLLVVARVLPVVVRVAQAVPVRPAVRVGPEPEVPAVPVHLWQAAHHHRRHLGSVRRWQMPRPMSARVACRAPVVAKVSAAVVRRVAE